LKVLFQNFDPGSGGGISNILLMLQAYCRTFPRDVLLVLCPACSLLTSLSAFPNVQVHQAPASWPREAYRLYWGFGGLSRFLDRTKVDVVWSMNIGPYVRSGTPQVLSLHNAYQVCPFEYTRFHPKNRAWVSALRWFFRRSMARSDGAIVQTNLMRDYALQFRRGPRKVVVIPKAVDSDRDVPAEQLPGEILRALQNEPEEDCPTFLYAATNEPHKNHKTVASAVEILRHRGRSVRLVFTIGEGELIAAAGADAKSLIESGHIVPLGWVGKEHLKSLYDTCNLCVMPSLLESLSSAYLEAMMWSRPQICSDLPFARDVCGDAAIYARPGDPEDWANQMEHLLDDVELQRKLIALGQRRMQLWPKSWVEVARSVRSFLSEVSQQHEAADMRQSIERIEA